MTLPSFTAITSIYGSNNSYWFSARDHNSSDLRFIRAQVDRLFSCKRWIISKPDTEPAESGRRAWMDLERACYNLQCEKCRKDCISFINGVHDAVNINLGKSLRTPNDFIYLRNFINEMSKNAFG